MMRQYTDAAKCSLLRLKSFKYISFALFNLVFPLMLRTNAVKREEKTKPP